jgi:PEP-CTERM motif
MKKLFLPSVAAALALLAPLATAKADSQSYNFCSTGVTLNFCGSVTVTATANASGGTDISFTVVNTTATTPQAVFTAIGINNSNLSGNATFSNLTVTQNGVSYTGWTVGPGSVIDGGGQTIAVSALSSTIDNGLVNSISSACSGSAERIYTCGIGPNQPVTISFHTSDSNVTIGDGSTDLYVNAAAERGACVAGCENNTTTTPEPATLALFATGLLGMGGPISRFRRRRNG